MSKAKKIRVDQLVMERGLFASRNQAQAAIMAGEIFSEEILLSKAGQMVAADIPITIRSKRMKYVSRGGYKLEGALHDFKLSVRDWRCLDIGSSTGGFTDCLLQAGAAHVCCYDVGHGQMHMRLRDDQRVLLREGVNARYLQPDDLPHAIDLAVIDVSFISLHKILPVVVSLVKPRQGLILALIKPQFEVGPAEIGKGGIVRDKKAQERAVQGIVDRLPEWGLRKVGVKSSCLKGTDGNQEYLLLAERVP